MANNQSLEPIIKILQLNSTAAKAFHHFTDNIHLWWPLASHSLALADAKSVVFEAKEGGRIYEIEKSGKQREWGRVLICEPPNKLVYSWVLEAPNKATEVEIHFKDEANGGSTMQLIHRGWENREDGAEWRGNYLQGWDGVLGAFEKTLA